MQETVGKTATCRTRGVWSRYQAFQSNPNRTHIASTKRSSNGQGGVAGVPTPERRLDLQRAGQQRRDSVPVAIVAMFVLLLAKAWASRRTLLWGCSKHEVACGDDGGGLWREPERAAVMPDGDRDFCACAPGCQCRVLLNLLSTCLMGTWQRYGWKKFNNLSLVTRKFSCSQPPRTRETKRERKKLKDTKWSVDLTRIWR